MTQAFGADYGQGIDCRVCRHNRFMLERGAATIDGKPVTTLVIRCGRCGTVYDILQIDWSATPDFSRQSVVINDGIQREQGFIAKQGSS